MNQENNDIANKYGVVTFETAKKLDWKEETNFSWVVYNGEIFLHSISQFHKKVLKEWEEQYHLEWDESDKLRRKAKDPIERKPFWLNERYNFGKIKVIEEVLHSLFGVKEQDLIIKNATDWFEAEGVEFIPAPQMHNLFNIIPDTIPYKVYYGSEISEFSLRINKEAVYYDSRIFTDKKFYTPIVDNNYAEAYAKIYLLLKENGYIK